MRPTQGRFALFALGFAALVVLAAPPARGADDAENPFTFSLSEVVLQPWFLDVDSRSSKFEEYRDMSSGMVFSRFRVLGESQDTNQTFDFEGFNLSRDDARYTLRYGNSGNYSVKLDYNLIPHHFGNEGTLLYSDANPVRLTISNAIQRDLQTQIAGAGTVDYPFLLGILQPHIDTAQSIDLGLDRKRAHARIDIFKLKTLSWAIDLKQETRQGNRPYGGSFGFSNIVEIPEPIDYRTASADLSGEWNGKRSGVRFGVMVSRFDNRNPYVMYDNPFRVSDSTDSRAYLAPGGASQGGPSDGLNALAPDNTASDIYVAARTKFGSTGWVNGNVRFGTMEQDDPLFAYTTNSAITSTSNPAAPFNASDVANLPEENADSKVDLVNVSLNGGMRFFGKLSVSARYRYYDYDNKSSQIMFPGYVRFDAVWEDIPRITVPYSYTRERAGVELGWDVARTTHVALSYDREMWDRTFREITESDEDIFKLSFHHRFRGDRVAIRASVEHGDRTTDEYLTEAQEVTFVNPTGINNQPGLRKYDEAVREYDAGSLTAIFNISDAVHIAAGLTMRYDDYPESEFGLIDYDTLMYNVEVDYTPLPNLMLYVFAHRTDAESFQQARQSGGTLSTNPQDNWDLTLDEVTNSWGLGVETRFAEVWSVNLRGQRSESDGNTRFFTPPGGTPSVASDFVEYDDNTWLVWSARLGRQFSRNVSGGISYVREEFETNRFARDGLMPYVPGSLIMNPLDGDYEADIVAVDLRMTF